MIIETVDGKMSKTIVTSAAKIVSDELNNDAIIQIIDHFDLSVKYLGLNNDEKNRVLRCANDLREILKWKLEEKWELVAVVKKIYHCFNYLYHFQFDLNLP